MARNCCNVINLNYSAVFGEESDDREENKAQSRSQKSVIGRREEEGEEVFAAESRSRRKVLMDYL